jgi:hypothetical protein
MRAGVDEAGRQIQLSHVLVELQAVTENRSMARQRTDECIVAVHCRRHVTHSVGDLVDLSPDLAGGLEDYDVELDVEALDRCAHACRPGSDHDHVVECFNSHEPTLRPWSGPVGAENVEPTF